ncbi:MAG: tetratricopeptide repeat protein [Nitrospirae bacterium]|nr:tetratricopeptide repeat protein [Nitrospirota bacterium]
MFSKQDIGVIVLDRWQNLFTQFRVIITYIRMLFIPVNLTLIYDYPVSFSFWEPRVYISFIVLCAIFASAIYMYYLANKTRNTKHRDILFISFAILWFFITIAPQSSIIPLSNWQLMEYRVYLASIGFFIAIVTALSIVVRTIKPKKLTVYFMLPMLTISLAFAIATYKRNSVWQSEVTLYEDNVRKVPTSIFANINLGSAYMDAGEFNKAISAFQQAKSLNTRAGLTHYTTTQTNLASAYTRTKRYVEATRELKEVLLYEPNNADIHTRLGLVYVQQKLLNEALDEFKTAIAIDNNFVDPRYYLGTIYAAQDRIEDALRQWRYVVSLNPDHERIYVDIGDAYMQQGKLQDALGEYKKALRLGKNNAAIHIKMCDAYKRLGRETDAALTCQTALQANTKEIKDPTVYFRLGLMHENQGNLDEAAIQYSMAIKLNPDYADAHNNLGVILGKQGKIDEALNEISTAISIRPDYADAHNNLGLCLGFQGKVDQARAEFTAALKIDPNHSGAKRNLNSLK